MELIKDFLMRIQFQSLSLAGIMINLLAFLLFLVVMLNTSASSAGSGIKVGAEVLYENAFKDLRGKHIGLITNQTAMVHGIHVIEVMHANGMQLVALFAPEHGLSGFQEDGENVRNGFDKCAGTRVYSLYGRDTKPTPEMLRGLDILVFDVQGLGTRFYTFISTMGLAMQAASAAHIPFLVLDRPNPLGGDYLAGPVLKSGYASFVGEYPIPVAYGLTIGELALMIKGERMLPGVEDLDLRVIRMEGWQRGMQWPETGLAWVRTSPNIPDFPTALLYPGICFLEGTAASMGRGTLEPFKLVGFPGINSDNLAKQLNDRNLSGVRFEPAVFSPRSIPGMSSTPKFADQQIPGVRIIITNPHAYRPVETGVQLLSALYGSLSQKDRDAFFQDKGFDQLAGTDTLRKAIESGSPPQDIIAGWQRDSELFAEKRRSYLLY